MTATAHAARGLTFEEPLLFEQGARGRSADSLPNSEGLPSVDPSAIFGAQARSEPPPLPELSEPEVVRHFVRLSQQNFGIDLGMYPLGSCTMKYNPKVNEWAARLPGFVRLHPLAPEHLAQGALELMWRLQRALSSITGLPGCSLAPSAGAQGELVGLMMIRTHHRHEGRSPRKVLIPDTAHGTNPASCALNGFEAVTVPVGPEGILTPERLAPLLDDEVAALMVTNPSTAGLFETHLPKLAAMVHAKGALVYGDGANLNALMGRVRPGDLGIDVMQINLHKTFTTPHGGGGPGAGPVCFTEQLAPYAPLPRVERDERGAFRLLERDARSIGRVRSFHGNFGMFVRAYAYLREMGAEGLARATDMAVLNANYLRARLAERWHLPYERPCMHEVLITDQHLQGTGVTTMDVAKRLIDHGFHPPTVYFPLVVRGAMLIEPTETESKDTLDAFAEAMASIDEEARQHPDVVRSAPHTTRLRRLDETRAARKPLLRFVHPSNDEETT